jgi:hypothetical protein
MRRLLQDRADDDALRQWAPLKPRPSLEEIAEAVAAELGYRGHGAVHAAVSRVENGSPELQKTAEDLHKRLAAI